MNCITWNNITLWNLSNVPLGFLFISSSMFDSNTRQQLINKGLTSDSTNSGRSRVALRSVTYNVYEKINSIFGFLLQPSCEGLSDTKPYCPLVLKPVCGSDGMMYPNECALCFFNRWVFDSLHFILHSVSLRRLLLSDWLFLFVWLFKQEQTLMTIKLLLYTPCLKNVFISGQTWIFLLFSGGNIRIFLLWRTGDAKYKVAILGANRWHHHTPM